jgi:hypothetical protein
MLNAAQLLAVANADAHTSNAGLPSYSDLLRIAQEATGVAVWHVPAKDKTDSAVAARCLEALAVFADTNGREQ